MISPKRREEILDALRRGTVPEDGLDLFAVGLERFEPTVDEDLQKVLEGGSVFKAVRGEYGCGKTFYSRWLQERARRMNFASAEVQISETVHEWPDVAGLSKAEMDDLLRTRQVLSNFFQNLKAIAEGNPMRYLSPTVAGRYPDKASLLSQRFTAETYLSFRIIDFRLAEDRNRIKMRYFLSSYDRGTATTRQRAVTFDRIGGAWLISEFDNFDFD